MKIIRNEQIAFSNILFDTLFGLVLYFSIDSILDIKNYTSLLFYLFGMIILIHWWIMFKASDDAYSEEVTDSGLDLIIGIIQVIFIDFIVLSSRSSDYILATKFLIALLSVDLLWAIVWLYIGEWHTKDIVKINLMEKELKNNIKIDSIAFILFILFLIIFQSVAFLFFIIGFILIYIIYIILSFKYKIIDIDFF